MTRLDSGIRSTIARLRRLPRPVRALLGVGLAVVLGTLAWLVVKAVSESRDKTWDRVMATGVLRVCTDPSWPPFETLDERTGAPRGLDVDLAGLLAARLAPGTPLRAEMVAVGFDSLYDALIAGRCDAVLSALPYERERTRDVSYSRSYFDAGQVIVVRDLPAGTGHSTAIETIDDLPGRVVGVEWGWVPEGEPTQKLALQALPVRRYDTPGDALRALQAGEIEAALVDRISALSYAGECRGVRIAGAPLTGVRYVIPVRPDSTRLLKEIDRVLDELEVDGTMARLVDKWF